ncbi:hypothetical protein PTE31013_03100 [Pandoraea terrigena]|uniref:Replication-associated protein G2P N-terminal domain-containing protein n=2 Tax=Pandoraea terrigena TaxID=2508292 RepID=A0A5E4W993_9BURK|nr:hypothetical protein PTE31013_03100 [Pandoraea terrigena]
MCFKRPTNRHQLTLIFKKAMNKNPLIEVLGDKFQVNIDTVEFSVSDVHVPSLGVTKMTTTSPDGEALAMSTNRKPIAGAHQRHPLQVRYRQLREHFGKNGVLFVEGSLFGFRYGQNVHTSARLRSGCVAALRRIRDQIGFTSTTEVWERWKGGDIELYRVDLAVNFDLGSESAVRALIKRLAHQLIGRNTNCHAYDGYVSLAPQRARKYCVAGYAKGPQLRSKLNRSKSDVNFARLVSECQSLLRVEVRLRRPELKKLGLSRAMDWTPERARDVFRQYVGKLPALNVTSGPVSEDEFNAIPPKLRSVFFLHKLGADLASIFPARTLARYRAKFRILGIDIACPNLESAPLNASLSIHPVRTPKWLIDAGMAPPKVRRMAPSTTKA